MELLIMVAIIMWLIRKIKRKIRIKRMTAELSKALFVDKLRSFLETSLLIIAIIAVLIWFIL